MSITVSWDNDEQNNGRLDFYGRWTLHELADAKQQVTVMAQAVDHQIGLIINLSDGPTLPDKMIAHATQVADLRSGELDEISYFVVIGSNALGKAIFKSFCKVCRPNKLLGKVTFAASPDEARAILAQHNNSYT